MEITAAHLGIMMHALGLYEGCPPRPYRNHFVAGGADEIYCRQLTAYELMREHKASELSGGMPVFSVTAKGRAYIEKHRTPSPKLTRSQKRYRKYILSDSNLKFGEWLKQTGGV